ncbi:MAG: SMI1/KNR4 family protein [Planctomycetaceae bacterium]
MTSSSAVYHTFIADLERLRARASRGSSCSFEIHGFQLYPVVKERVLSDFEQKHAIRLPEDYREFLSTVGNGGAGPGYGLFRLGELDGGEGSMSWEEGDWGIGSLRESFPFQEKWNDLDGDPSIEDYEPNDPVFDRLVRIFEEGYFRPVDGAVPICHHGGGVGSWLVVTGPEAGHVWCDNRVNRAGVAPFPLSNSGGERWTFRQWYRNWLDGELGQLTQNIEH